MDSGSQALGGVNETPPVRATLDAWRARGADRLNPARFRFIDALERRAARHDGEVRRALDRRLASLVASYAHELARAEAAARPGEPSPGAPSGAPDLPKRNLAPRGPLAQLTDLLTSRVAAHPAKNDGSALGGEAHVPHAPSGVRAAELPMLEYFRETWSRFSTEKQLRHSLEQVPFNAGPLNSNSLIHRSLSLMREASPGYLQHFLSYVEALSWMDQLAGPPPTPASPAGPAAEAPRAANAKKGVRGKARAR